MPHPRSKRVAAAWLAIVTAPVMASAAVTKHHLDPRLLVPYFRDGETARAAETFRLGRFTEAATALAKAEKKLGRTAPEKQPVRYLHALALAAAGQHDQAATLFQELTDSYPVLRDYHGYHAARSHLLAGRAEQALHWAARVDDRAVLRAEATLIELEALFRLERWQALAAAAGTFLERYDNGPRRAEARFRQAHALERLGKPLAEVVPLYRLIWTHAPTEAWARRAEERVATLLADAPADRARPFQTPTARQWFDRAMALADKQQNAEAETAFATALAGDLDPTATCQALFHQAQSIFKQRNRPRAAPVFNQAIQACRDAKQDDLMVKALYQGARCHASMGETETAFAKYTVIEELYPEHSYADDARLRTAELHRDKGNEKQSQAVLAEVPTRYPRGDMLGESLFRLAFSAYQARDFDQADKWLDENLRLIPHETVWYAEGRALYWKARIREQRRQRKEAAQYYERAIREYPLSVYALMAFERLRHAAPDVRKALVTELRKDKADTALPVDFGHHPAYADPQFQRAVELARLGLGDDARRELARIGWSHAETRDQARDRKDKNTATNREGDVPIRERAQWLTAVLLDRGRIWSASHAVPRYNLLDWKRTYPTGKNTARWRLAYPNAYPEWIGLHSRKNQVPSALQLAIMREESAFNPQIESFANAIGLTQMLVRTAQRFSDQKVTRETLFDPEGNINLGSRFLAFLLRHYNETVPTAISGYNAGEGAVDLWLRERGHLELDEFLELIPYDETRGYTKRVLASYFAYHWLYDTRRPIPQLDFSLQRARKAAPQKTSPTARGG